jgi:DNA-binding response OmpR family regulator
MPPRILLLEDNDALARATRLVIETTTEAAVDVAATIADGTSLLDLHDYALLFADVTLPDGDGAQWAGEVRRNRDVPVVLTTAHDLDATTVAAHGVDGVLLKPVGMDDLLATMQRLMPIHG